VNTDTALASTELVITRAQELTTGADTHAADIAARSAAFGWIGSALAMGQVRQAISDFGAQLSDLARAVAEPRASITATSTHPTPQRCVDALLMPVVCALTDTHRLLRAAIVRVGDVKQLAARPLQGGQPGAAAGRAQRDPDRARKRWTNGAPRSARYSPRRSRRHG
jgi:hypothetical protein